MASTELTPEQLAATVWVTNEFLETLLKENGFSDEICVKSHKIENLVKAGENYSSQIYRLKIVYDDNKKNESTLPLVMKMVVTKEILENEINFYEVALPNLTKVFKVRTGLTPKITPKYYISKRNDALFLEEIFSAKMADRKLGFTLTQMELVIRYLAKFHSMSLALYEEDPTLPEKFTGKIFYIPENTHILSTYFVRPLDVIREEVLLWPGFEHFSDKIKFFQDNIIEWLFKSRELNQANLYAGIHGDYWLNNILINEEKDQVIMVDFQGFHWAPAAIDITQLFYTSFTAENRAKHTQHLIKLYTDELLRWLTKLNLDTSQITYDKIVEDCDKMQRVSLSIPLCFKQLSLKPDDIGDVNIQWLFTQNIMESDHAWRKPYKNEMYINEMKQILLEADKKGYFK